MSDQRGFSLIELLVVVSIIGFLSSVVLAALTTARNRGVDAAIKANLANIRPEAELFYQNNNYTFNGVCARSGTVVIGDQVDAAEYVYDKLASGHAYADATANTWDDAQCHDTNATGGSGWVAWVPLRASASGSPVGFCVDHTGAAKIVTATLAANVVVCP